MSEWRKVLLTRAEMTAAQIAKDGQLHPTIVAALRDLQTLACRLPEGTRIHSDHLLALHSTISMLWAAQYTLSLHNPDVPIPAPTPVASTPLLERMAEDYE